MASPATAPDTLDPGKETVLETLSLQSKYIEVLERQVRLLEGNHQRVQIKDEAIELSRPMSGRHPRGLSMSVQAGTEVSEGEGDVEEEEGDDGDRDKGEGKVKYRMKRYNEEGLRIEEAYNPKKLENKLSHSKSIATVMLLFDHMRNHYDTQINIESSAVRAILQEKLKHYPGYHWDTQALTISAPFQPLVHNWDILTDVAHSDPNNEGCRDLADILHAIESIKDVKDYFDTRGTLGGSVVFESLWTIFPPGEFILLPNSFMKQEQVFIVREAVEERQGPRSHLKKCLAVHCWAYDWDGSKQVFNRVGIVLKIEAFKGQRLITNLSCYPLKYYPGDMDKLKIKLIRRGERFRFLCTRPRGSQMFEYDGKAHYRGTGVRHVQVGEGGSEGTNDDSSIMHQLSRLSRLSRSKSSEVSVNNGRQLNTKGRVMVDFDSYLRHGPNGPIPMGELPLSVEDEDDECRCPKCTTPGGPRDNQKYDWDLVDAKAPFELDQFLICPPRVLGYHLMEKKWLELQVDLVMDIENPKIRKAFDELQLATVQKDLIKELVQSHANDKIGKSESPRGVMTDLTKGKGEGLVILLHGPPGVGKTLTAESVAQVTGKPLFPMGVGDVTTNPALVEKRLEQMFELAAAWQAVMLFDEADVFLESRATTTDVTRVGLVSVLLRVLEYYQGILILTTNRIRSFDIAVQSRINLAIQFKDLTEKQKRQIFTNFVRQLDDDFVENKSQIINWMRDDDDAATDFSGLNGRQVRNVIFSAASLARVRKEPENILRLADIKRILGETVKFQLHLQELTKSQRSSDE